MTPTTDVGMLIRRPSDEVFNAFIDPETTTKFWFTKSSGPLDVGEQVEWSWEMYDVSTLVNVKRIDPGRRIEIEWESYNGETSVEWTFDQLEDDCTFVKIRETGFTGTDAEVGRQVADSTGGFTLVLAGLKAFLEHGIQLNLIGDRFPEGIDDD